MHRDVAYYPLVFDLAMEAKSFKGEIPKETDYLRLNRAS